MNEVSTLELVLLRNLPPHPPNSTGPSPPRAPISQTA